MLRIAAKVCGEVVSRNSKPAASACAKIHAPTDRAGEDGCRLASILELAAARIPHSEKRLAEDSHSASGMHRKYRSSQGSDQGFFRIDFTNVKCRIAADAEPMAHGKGHVSMNAKQLR